ncbi:MAG: translation initiation factor IF-2 [Chthoniobacterales bacterium]
MPSKATTSTAKTGTKAKAAPKKTKAATKTAAKTAAKKTSTKASTTKTTKTATKATGKTSTKTTTAANKAKSTSSKTSKTTPAADKTPTASEATKTVEPPKPAPSPTPAEPETKPTKVKSASKAKPLPPISRVKQEEENAAKAKAEAIAKEKAAQAAKKESQETVDLLAPKKKVKKASSTSKALPRIANKPEIKPVPTPVEPKAEAQTATVTEEDGQKTIHLKPPIIVKDLAEAMGLKPFQIIADLMALNIFAAINQGIEPDIASQVCEKHGFVFEKEKREKGAGVHKQEVVVEAPPEPEEPQEEELTGRPPIITIMGHVDHGKTSLLDYIRKSRVVSGEAGGITQHIGAYSVQHEGMKLTFLDTPGHAAFTAMRARGATVTDIVIIVVAADDGLMPQTIEAISHAKASGATVMVAINKIDLASANPDKVKQQLQEHDLTPEEWGGSTIVTEVSATKGIGVSDLLEMISLQAEVLELKASAKIDARATVIEAQIEPGRGPTGTVIVKMGTLKVGSPFICGNHWGKIKQLINDHGKPIKSAGPATPVKILGFSGLPLAGDELVVMDSDRSARQLSDERINDERINKLTAPKRATLESLFDNIAADQKKTLRIVVKADVQGSLEALVAALEDLPSEKINLNIIHSAVGPISDSDVLLSSASDAIIIGFGIKVEAKASTTARKEGVQIKLYSIIYELIDQVKEAMTGMLDPMLRESVVGHAEVKQVFNLTKGKVAGCMVTDGRISRTSRARVLRGRQPIYDGGLATLRRFHDEVKEVRAGLECGIKLGDFSEYEPGDIIEAYNLEKVAQTLE